MDAEPLPLPPGPTACRLAARFRPGAALVYVACDERRAERVEQALRALFPALPVLAFPPWDCLPYDRVSPSRAAMGRRVATLRRLARGAEALVVTSAAAVTQRVAPRGTYDRCALVLAEGEPYDADALRRFLHVAGYRIDDRVDEPGEAALRGGAIDLFPPGAERPVRADVVDGVLRELRAYDPATQRSVGAVERLVLEPASEVLVAADEERPPGLEHHLPDRFPALETLLDHAPGAAVTLDPAFEDAISARDEIARDAWEARAAQRIALPEPERIWLGPDAWAEALAGRAVERIPAAVREPPPAPEEHLAAGGRVLVTAPTERDLARRLRRLGRDAVPVDGWEAARALPAGGVGARVAPLEEEFVHDGVLVLATAPRVEAAAADPLGPPPLVRGDLVVHLEHGLGRLDDFQRVEAGGQETDCVVLRYAGDATLLVPADRIHQVWRYGSADVARPLDRLNGEAWKRRRAKIEEELARTARELVALAEARARARAAVLVPPPAEFHRFVRRFPHPETPDQRRAIAEVLADLASGRPMDRLVCGDVGYGKTEVALRACAAAALAGKQVAVAVPTTVLARQHFETFSRRFAGLGLRVEMLSRVVGRARAEEVRAGLRDGSVRVVIGTHALASRTVAFADLGLLVVDEEQRFGKRHKDALRALGRDVHRLTLTATPIPRTLHLARVGVQDLSVLATPPVRRQPVRTVVAPFDPVVAQEALRRERRRGGQSFVVCPHVDDLEPMRARLAELCPELDVRVAHGQLPPARLDETVVAFADGEGDVLLSTDIIESGLDIPAANTILVWRADRFGLAQLHQLRGRVGRGRVRGQAILTVEAEGELAEATERRLRALEQHDRLGAGFEISVSDLDRRGAGDLLGERQSGHLRQVGAELAQELLDRALRAARGEDPGAQDLAEVHLDAPHGLPVAYVHEPEVRLRIYRRLAGLRAPAAFAAFLEELEDRFGEAPEPVRRLVAAAELRAEATARGVARLDLGPRAIALAFRAGRAPMVDLPDVRASGARLVLEPSPADPDERLRAARALVARLARAPRAPAERPTAPRSPSRSRPASAADPASAAPPPRRSGRPGG